MKGWILDVYPDLNKGKMVIWLRTKKHCYRVLDDHETPFYIKTREDKYRDMINIFEDMGFETEMVKEKLDLRNDKEATLLKISPGKVFDPRTTASALDFFNGHEDMEFYNIDVPMDIRYLAENNIMPSSHVERNNGWLASDTPECVHYPLPDMRVMNMDIANSAGPRSRDDVIKEIILDQEPITGEESDILEELSKQIRRKDPDFIVTSGGDSFVISYLSYRAELNSVELILGRERSNFTTKQGSSYHSYGRVLYRPPSHMLKGRIHIDRNSSFMYGAGGLDGLIEISRLSRIPIQRLSRLSPGTAIDSMEMVHVMNNGYLIPWKKNFTERFKSASKLILSDRGGHIFEPKIGVHEDVLKFDFASMYPSIIARYNLSPETLNRSEGGSVPGLDYRIRLDKRGMIPTVVEPVIQRRQYYKQITSGDDKFKRRADCLKWLLVTCFGYTGYKKARFGSIEVHESITAFGREILLEAADIAQRMGFELIHGIVDSLWLKGSKDTDEFLQSVKQKTGIELEWEGKYDWIVFPTSKIDPRVGVPNRYFGKLDGELECRGIHTRRHDTPSLFKEIQKELLDILVTADNVEQIVKVLPNCLVAVKDRWRVLMNGDVDRNELLFTKTVGKDLDDYGHMTETKAALIEYRKMGFNVQPGQKIRYIIAGDKVSIEWQKEENYHRRYYEDYLFRTAGEILDPFGYSENKLKYIVKNQARPRDSPLTTPEAIM